MIVYPLAYRNSPEAVGANREDMDLQELKD
jgi:hypothetical protein